ncbi:MAG: DUF6941 family protein [Planctomycetota bacterium]|jgi:hypothetical protein
MAPRPSVKAILICDQVIHEFRTNKKSLIGIFEDIHLPRFPARYPQIAVYVNLTDAHGKYVLELRLISTKDGTELGRGSTPEVEIDSPLRTCEFALQIQNLVFKEAGKYEFQILANSELLSTKSFSVKQLKTTPPPGQMFPPAGDAADGPG